MVEKEKKTKAEPKVSQEAKVKKPKVQEEEQSRFCCGGECGCPSTIDEK